jgi:hypothetical protein
MREIAFFVGFLCLALGGWYLWGMYPSYQILSSQSGQLSLLLNPQKLSDYYALQRFVYLSAGGIVVGLALLYYGSRPESLVLNPVEKKVITDVEGDITERMTKLKNLYENKLITEEEYNKRKSELLSKI